MKERSITDYANDAVKRLLTIQPHCELMNGVTLEVRVEDETLAIIDFEGSDMFIEVHIEEHPAIGRTVLRPGYVAGYYKHVYGGMWNPPEIEDVQLDSHRDVIGAVSQLVSVDWMWKMDSVLEAEAFCSDAGDIFEEEIA